MGLGWPWDGNHGKACYRKVRCSPRLTGGTSFQTEISCRRPWWSLTNNMAGKCHPDAVKPVWRVWLRFDNSKPAIFHKQRKQPRTKQLCNWSKQNDAEYSKGNSLATSNRNWRGEPFPAFAVPEISIGPPSAPDFTRPPEVNRRISAVYTEEILI